MCTLDMVGNLTKSLVTSEFAIFACFHLVITLNDIESHILMHFLDLVACSFRGLLESTGIGALNSTTKLSAHVLPITI